MRGAETLLPYLVVEIASRGPETMLASIAITLRGAVTPLRADDILNSFGRVRIADNIYHPKMMLRKRNRAFSCTAVSTLERKRLPTLCQLHNILSSMRLRYS